MTKAKTLELALEICTTHELSAEATAAITALLEPKKGGSKADVNDYTCFDADGNVTNIFCTYHKKWEPVTSETEDGETVELFGASKTPNGYSRECKVGVKQWREANKEYKDSKDAIITDVLDGAITGEDGKAAIATLDEGKDYSRPHTDGIGEDERPCEAVSTEAE